MKPHFFKFLQLFEKIICEIKINDYLCNTNKQQTIKTFYTMTRNINEISDAEILAILNKSLKEMFDEDIDTKRRNRIRKSKADFCNLAGQEVIFIAE